MGHIALSREADLVVVAPATADLMAKMAAGLADDLASTALLATDKPVLIAPAMNARMWEHPATRRNVARLAADGVRMVGPERRRHGLRRVRPRPHGRAARDPGRRSRRLLADRAARPLAGRARPGDQRADPRADRSGALPLQPLVGQPGPCDRRARWPRPAPR